jgi:hypothetical protein
MHQLRLTESIQDKVLGHAFDWTQAMSNSVPVYVPTGRAAEPGTDVSGLRWGLTIIAQGGLLLAMQYVVFHASTTVTPLATVPDAEIILVRQDRLSAWHRDAPPPRIGVATPVA